MTAGSRAPGSPSVVASPAAGGIRLVPVPAARGWGLRIEAPGAVWEQTAPVAVVTSEADVSGTAVPYEVLTADGGAVMGGGVTSGAGVRTWVGTARVPLGAAAWLDVRDTWTLRDGAVDVDRVARVASDGAGAAGHFMTRLTVRRADRAPGWTDRWTDRWADIEPFVPGVTYGNAAQVAAGALGGLPARRSGVSTVLIREDRMAAPVFASRFADGAWVAVLHRDAAGATTIARDGDVVDGGETLVDARLRSGSLGGTTTPSGLELGMWFPGTEGEHTYSTGGLPLGQPRAWRRRFHPVVDGLEQRYGLTWTFGAAESFPAMCAQVWRATWRALEPRTEVADLAAVVRSTMTVLSGQVRTVDGRTGVPLEADAVATAPDGTEDTSAVMGFVGANTDAGHLMLRTADRLGGRAGRELRAQGLAILDTFATIPLDPPAGEGFDVATGSLTTYRTFAGRPAVYARSVAEGCLATLRAALWEAGRGIDHADWRAWTRSGGDWLVAQQRTDGSLPRAWEAGTGAVLDPSRSAAYAVVPFLVALTDATGDRRYARAALGAGEHVWRTVGAAGAYAGATLDNPDVVDKEAAMLAAEAFLALHDATAERVWLDRAVSAASLAETWTYLWDVPMPDDAVDGDLHWKRGVPTTGHQLITTGASMTDGFLAVNASTFARLWTATGDPHWLDVARLVTHGTTTMLALDGRTFDLRGPGWQQEHWCFGGRRGYGLNRRWLPWVAVAHVGGVVRLEDLGADVAAAVLHPDGAPTTDMTRHGEAVPTA